MARINMKCFNDIIVFGSGRWARTWIETLLALRQHKGRVIVFAPLPSERFASWLHKFHHKQQIETIDDFSQAIQSPKPAIIASAAGTHRDIAVSTLSKGLPTLVEKPMALELKDAMDIVDASKKNNIDLAISNVFLFSEGLKKFKDVTSTRDLPVNILIQWTDAKEKTERYDSSVPVFKDVLPHVVGIVEYLFEETEWIFSGLNASRGGQKTELKLECGGMLIEVILERNAPKRKRILEVTWPRGSIATLDFRDEPSKITVGGDGIDQSARPRFAKPSSLASMASSFLDSCGGLPFDQRLNAGGSLRSCELAEAILPSYNDFQQQWLNSKNSQENFIGFDDFLYSNVEAAQYEKRLGRDEIFELVKTLTTEYYDSSF